ncbi:hypothetical protein RB614_09190 [Phytohabitans sp. ZYX-F-186]|uniref:Thymidylate kinase n=1 Tax=Phytohabitans maris TaxID=3071409 RepID=A0ABU0ZC91_9ACTN|nr:hypothetical protein [Phytohabitans sp. ZYX-F-186]MDQ7904694.1 hypothetical protein [Phytohabitans sp. ZYX-F-186]
MSAAGVTGVGRWVSVEGLNGVGKTYLTGRLATRLGQSCRLVSELTDHGPEQLTGQVTAALARRAGTFLRTGHPVTEMFALLALKVYEYERLTADPRPPALVLEDRGPDTVAVYQAAIMTLGQPAAAAAEIVDRVLTTARTWRPLPTLTMLVVDDLDACIGRYSDRLGAPVNSADRELLVRVDTLYRELAISNPDRIRVVDRTGRPQGDVLAEMEAHCRTLLKKTGTQ